MRQIVCVLLGYLILTTTHAASFDCGRSVSSLETLICSDSLLSKQDELLSLSYKKAMAVSTERGVLIESQRAWIKVIRSKCVDIECLSRAYEDRIRELQGIVVLATSDPLADIEGTYLMQSLSCSQYDGKGGWGACPPTTADCLSIKQLTIDTAFISVESYQTNGHLCSASGTAKIAKPGVLELSELEDGFIDITSHPITFDYSSNLIAIEGPQEICGARASWDGVSFSKNSRKTREVISCSDYQNLKRYLSPEINK